MRVCAALSDGWTRVWSWEDERWERECAALSDGWELGAALSDGWELWCEPPKRAACHTKACASGWSCDQEALRLSSE